MKLGNLIYKSPSGRIILAVLAMIFTLWVGPANSASEPGTVTIVLVQEPLDLDPGSLAKNNEGQVLMRNVLETLTEMNPDDSRIMPRLATSWKQIDANTWQFSLRKGVKFHDGQDFNAEAVVFSLKRIYDKRLTSTTRNKFFTGNKLEGKALDSHTVEIKTDNVEPLMLTLMSALPICSPSTPLDKMIRNPIGTGPYKFVRWDAGTQIISERFDGYWGKQPQVKKAVYVWRTESSVQAAMVLIGEADLAPNIAEQDANRPDMDYSYLNSETLLFRVGSSDPPLNDRRVRMALNYAIDKNAIRGSILSKDMILATCMVVPNISGHNPDLKPYPYDPQKAKQLLDEAKKDGVPVDREILLVGRTGFFPGTAELTEAMMAMYKAVGLNVKMTMLEAGVFKTYENKPFIQNVGPYLSSKLHDNNKGDAVFTVPYSYHCDGKQSPVCDKTLDDLIEKAQVATGEERKTLWQAAFKRIHDDIVPNVFLFHMVGYARVGKRINFKTSLTTNCEIQLSQITFK